MGNGTWQPPAWCAASPSPSVPTTSAGSHTPVHWSPTAWWPQTRQISRAIKVSADFHFLSDNLRVKHVKYIQAKGNTSLILS